MKQEIIDWYSERHYQPEKMFIAGNRWGYSRDKVESAMIHCHNKIVNEEKDVADIYVARYVRNICKEHDNKEYQRYLTDLYQSSDKLKEYKLFMFSVLTIGGLLNLLFWFFILNWGY